MVTPSLCRTLSFSMCLHQAQKSFLRLSVSTMQDPEEPDLILKLALLCFEPGLDYMASRDSFKPTLFYITNKSSLDRRGGAKNLL